MLHRGLCGGAPEVTELSTQQRRDMLQARGDVAHLALRGFGSTLRLDFAEDEVGQTLTWGY